MSHSWSTHSLPRSLLLDCSDDNESTSEDYFMTRHDDEIKEASTDITNTPSSEPYVPTQDELSSISSSSSDQYESSLDDNNNISTIVSNLNINKGIWTHIKLYGYDDHLSCYQHIDRLYKMTISAMITNVNNLKSSKLRDIFTKIIIHGRIGTKVEMQQAIIQQIRHHHKQNEIQSTTKAAATIPTSETTTATTTFNDAYNNNNSNNTNASDELDFDSTVEIIPFTISDINNITATPTTTIFNEDTIPLHVTTFNNNQGINDDSYIHSTTTQLNINHTDQQFGMIR